MEVDGHAPAASDHHAAREKNDDDTRNGGARPVIESFCLVDTCLERANDAGVPISGVPERQALS